MSSTESPLTEAELIEASWSGHNHDQPEGSDPLPAHVHAVGADWAVSFGIPMTMVTDGDSLDVVQLMEFRTIIMGMAKRMEDNRHETDLSQRTVNDQQFAIIAYNVDTLLTQSLIAVVDKAIETAGIHPPCQLQPVESSNIRSFGFVQVQEPDTDITPDTGRLYVAFVSEVGRSALWAYDDVPSALVQGFIGADSKGSYFQTIIKNGGFVATKVAG